MLKIFKKWAAEYLLSEQNKPVSLKDLKYEFTDSKGQRYYSWDSMDKVPTNRVNELVGLSMWSDAKISPENLELIAGEIIKLNFDIVKGGSKEAQNKRHAQITTLCEELRNRKNYAIPAQVIIPMAAMLCVREDENPNTISNRIQEEKIAEFTSEKIKGNTFFLKSRIFKMLLSRLVGTNVKEANLLMKWAQDEQRQRERFETILQHTESKTTTKTKENL